MQVALSYAQKASDMNEVPIGAIIVRNNQVIGAGHNFTITKNSVTAHAELEAIDAAGTLLGNHRLIDCDMYVTVEPCHMCAKAIVHARLRKLFIGCLEPKEGAIFSQDNFFDKTFLNHQVFAEHGILEKEARHLIQNFFKERR